MANITVATDIDLKKKAGKFNPDDFNFIVVSRDIKLKKDERDNIAFMPSVVPPRDIMKYAQVDEYDRVYMDYIQQVMSYPIAVLVKAIIDNDFDVVFVCTEAEKAMGYVEIFTEYIGEVYDFNVGKFKKLLKGSSEFEIPKESQATILEEAEKVIAEFGEKYKDIEIFNSTHKGPKKK